MNSSSVLAAPDASHSVPLARNDFESSLRDPGSTLMSETTLPAMQVMQMKSSESANSARRALQAAALGSVFPMRRMMQEDILAQFHRLPGLPSSDVALDVLRGKDTDLDYEDYLNLPENSPELPGGDMDRLGATHEAMERALRIAPKAPF